MLPPIRRVVLSRGRGEESSLSPSLPLFGCASTMVFSRCVVVVADVPLPVGGAGRPGACFVGGGGVWLQGEVHKFPESADILQCCRLLTVTVHHTAAKPP